MTTAGIARPWPRPEHSPIRVTDTAVSEPAEPMIWGHRGASKAELQNSPAAFKAAIEMGAHGVELDIRRTADDVLVVHHDADLTDGRFIVETVAADLPEYVPTLAWVLDLYRDRLVNIEVKSVAKEPDFSPDYPVVDLLLEVLATSDPEHRHIVTSFDTEVLRRVQERNENVATGRISYDPAVLADVSQLEADGYQAVMSYVPLTNAALVDEAHARGLFVGVWTANEPADMKRLRDLGVDALMTDLPDLAFATLA